MKIHVNGKVREVAAQQLDQLLIELGYGNAVVATALNGEFVSVRQRAQITVSADDRLEVVAPMQGG